MYTIDSTNYFALDRLGYASQTGIIRFDDTTHLLDRKLIEYRPKIENGL